MIKDCPGCQPGSPIPAFTSEDYQRALELLASRTDLDDAQRAQAKGYLDNHHKETPHD